MVNEGIIRFINNSKEEQPIRVIKISQSLFITHLLFIDDDILLGLGYVEEWNRYRGNIDSFCKSIRIIISGEKYMFLHENPEARICEEIIGLFPFIVESLDQRFKNLCYHLKPNYYKIEDWNWLLQKVDRRIKNWTFHWMSLSGRLVLVN